MLALAACGGGDDETSTDEPATFTGEEVVAAFEAAAGGYPFEETTSLVEGASAYAPRNSTDPAETAPLTEALGDSSIVWQVAVFDGADPPVGEAAAREVAFSSKEFEEVEPGIFIGDSDIAYVANENVVINGPTIDGAADPTLAAWKATLEGL